MNKNKSNFYHFDVLAILLYYIPGYYLYAFIYDIAHSKSVWGDPRADFNYGSSPEIHFAMFMISFISIALVLIKVRHKSKFNTEIVTKRLIVGAIFTLAYLPIVHVLNSINNTW